MGDRGQLTGDSLPASALCTGEARTGPWPLLLLLSSSSFPIHWTLHLGKQEAEGPLDPALGWGTALVGLGPAPGWGKHCLGSKEPPSPGSLGPILPLSPILSPGPLRPLSALLRPLTSPVLLLWHSASAPSSFCVFCLALSLSSSSVSLLFCLTLFLSLSVSLCLFPSSSSVSPAPAPAWVLHLFGPRASFLPILPSLL